MQSILAGKRESGEQKGARAEAEAKWHVDANEWFTGGVLGDAEIAGKFGGLVFRSRGGGARSPSVEDRGSAWLISDATGDGALYLVAKRRDAQVVYLGASVDAALAAASRHGADRVRTSIRRQLLAAMRNYPKEFAHRRRSP